jgi:integrase
MAKVITDAAIKAAIRDTSGGRKTSVTLSDHSPRGKGRLVLLVRPGVAEWYAQRYVGGKRKLSKIGTYPDVSLAAARDRFAKGGDLAAEPAQQHVESEKSFRAMLDAYADSRSDIRPDSVRNIRRIAELTLSIVDGGRPAASIKPEDIIAVIKPVYDRGAKSNADKFRAYLGSAFRWAMRSTYDYRSKKQIDWGIRINPVDAIARDKEAAGVGARWLQVGEFVEYLAHLDDPTVASVELRNVIKLIMLTGQRAEEIIKIRPENWDSEARVITWPKTKNGRPHAIPVCARAAAILDGITPGRGGWMFPNKIRDDRPTRPHSLMAVHNRYTKAQGCARFTSRDLRRTWKTLAGEAGISKADRDLLQNHVKNDVSSKHYDRYDAMREKRAAVDVWQDWIEAEIARRAKVIAMAA